MLNLSFVLKMQNELGREIQLFLSSQKIVYFWGNSDIIFLFAFGGNL